MPRLLTLQIIFNLLKLLFIIKHTNCRRRDFATIQMPVFFTYRRRSLQRNGRTFKSGMNGEDRDIPEKIEKRGWVGLEVL